MPPWKGIVGKGFRADEFRQYVGTLTFTDWRPQFVVVHNTSAPRLSQWHSTPGAQRMQNLQSYYRDQLGWSAGPHLFIADDLIWVFTPLTTSGIHSPSWNGISWGVEIVGEYQPSGTDPGEDFVGAIRANAIDALAILHQWRGLDPQTIRFHKEDPLTTHKTCPGSKISKPDLIAAAQVKVSEAGSGEHLQGTSVDFNQTTSGGAPAVLAKPFLGWKPQLPDQRDYPYGAMRLGLEKPAVLPPKVDLRAWCPPIFDQGQLNSCTANAIAAALQFDQKKQNLSIFVPSRLFVYYNERKIENDVDRDRGAYIRDGIKSVASDGVCKEDEWPYDIQAFAQQPETNCYQDALKFKALSYYQLDSEKLDELRSCLAAGYPFIFGFTIYDSFFQADANGGVVPMPGNEPIAGGHAVLAVGYDDTVQRFIIQNSWGTAGRGDNGFYYMPYGYLTSNLSNDFWTIRSVASNPVTVAASDTTGQPSPPIANTVNTGLVGWARDMEEAKKYVAFIAEAAKKYSLSPSLICALGSRESGWGQGSDMKPPGPAGTGDWAPRNPARFGYAMPPDHLGWGRGLLQIDYQDEFAKSGNWQDPRANILFGCNELAGNIAYFTKSAPAGVDPTRAGIAAYNCGRGGVTKALKNGYDVDYYTAHNDYSQDVLNRADWFKQRGFDQL